jgi:hypothetical protein
MPQRRIPTSLPFPAVGRRRWWPPGRRGAAAEPALTFDEALAALGRCTAQPHTPDAGAKRCHSAELGIDLTREFPKPLTDDAVHAADILGTMGCTT